MSFFEIFSEEIVFGDIINVASLIAVIIGGAFALYQWKKGNVYKRTEIVEKLIETVRTDSDISSIIELIDWEQLTYDGDFYLKIEQSDESFNYVYEKDLSKKIDKTLAHFSYICYLKKQHTLTKKDMKIFDYEIRRFVDNNDIANYLFSLYHYSKSLNVHMPFSYLVEHCVKKGVISNDFYDLESENYECFLDLSDEDE